VKIIPFPSRAHRAKTKVTQTPRPDDRTKEEATEMEIARQPTPRTRTNTLSRQLSTIHGPCIDCPGCNGTCLALLDALTVPDAVLRRSARSGDGD
tara:strand:- start:6543 stop:6827 length:285 start_codon:yes stop_codon:yes gene_type:complete